MTQAQELRVIAEFLERLRVAGANDLRRIADELEASQPAKLVPMTEEQSLGIREWFESWYVENAFDLTNNPIGSRDFVLQLRAAQAYASNFMKSDFGAKQLLPSAHQIGTTVRVLGLTNASDIDAVMFRTGKVWYEVGGNWFPSEEVQLPLIIVDSKKHHTRKE